MHWIELFGALLYSCYVLKKSSIRIAYISRGETIFHHLMVDWLLYSSTSIYFSIHDRPIPSSPFPSMYVPHAICHHNSHRPKIARGQIAFCNKKKQKPTKNKTNKERKSKAKDTQQQQIKSFYYYLSLAQCHTHTDSAFEANSFLLNRRVCVVWLCDCATVRGVYLAVYITSYSTQHSEVIPWRIHVAFYMWAVNVQFAVGWYQSWLPNTPPKCLCDWMLNRGPDFICSGWLDLVPVTFLSNTISHLILRTE